MWVAPARISGKTLTDANQFMFCGLQIPKPKTIGWLSLVTKNKTQTLLIRDEPQLNCVSLRPQLDYEVAWRAVKGQDERPNPAPLTALHATGHSIVDVGEKQIWRAATSALTFMTFS